MNKFTTIITSVIVLGSIHFQALAQSPKRPDDTRPDVEKEIEKPKVKPQLTLPPIEELPQVPPTPGVLKFPLKDVAFEGNTVFSKEELRELVKNYIGRTITTADLENIRLAITNHYINNGYINSGALIPDQDLDSNILKLQIIEGKLSTVNLQNDGRLKPNYLTVRISPEPDQPLNIIDLQERLYLLQQNPRVKRINAALGPGAERGESILDISVTEDKPYALSIEFNNFRPPSIGEKQGELRFSHLNITGAGDSIDAIYNGTEGLNSGYLFYKYPILKNDATLNINLEQTESKVIEEQFKDLDLESESWSVNAGITYPIHKSIHAEYSVEFELSRRHSKSFLGNDLMQCQSHGACDVTALRLTQSSLWHNRNEIFAFRHVLSVGINAINSTIFTDDEDEVNEFNKHDVVADSRFTAWLLQAQWAKRYSPLNLQTVVRADAQLAFDYLMAMEQFSVGGAYTVRGYRENQFVRDNGVLASVETRIPIYQTPSTKQQILTMIFADYGNAWNYKDQDNAEEISSVGLGLRWTYTDRASAQVYWAHQLREMEYESDSWQDDGFHVSIRVNAL
ncbi:ShlB/FhaC/HecB family hemolysin secretion/activation protein [Kaarinaea lacus]